MAGGRRNLAKNVENEYIIAGSGIVIEFAKTQKSNCRNTQGVRRRRLRKKGNENNKTGSGKTAWHGKRCGIGFVDEVKVNADGSLGYIRRMNGDQSHQGRHVRIPTGHFSILHVVLYDYK